MKNFITTLKRLLIIPGTFDPDDLRRRQVLNTGLMILLFVTIFIIILILGELLIMDEQNPRNYSFLAVGTGSIVFWIVLLRLNRWEHVPSNLVGWIFILSLVGITALSDSPLELASGRSIIAWAIPITLSVIILPPASVFVVELIITVVLWYYAVFLGSGFQSYILVEIYLVSFLAWLGMTIAEHAVRDARNESRKNAAILEGVAEGVIVLGPNDQLVLANQAAAELTGSDLAKIVPMMESAEVGGRALSFRWSEVEGVGWVAIVRDISRQVEIDHAKDAILRVVSHEMRTPLAAILGFAEVLESRPVPGMATRIRVNAQRMLKLVNDLLDVAQLQAGVLTVHQESFPPSLLVSYILENFLKVAEAKGVALEVHTSPGLPERVTGDVQRLEQVIANLVDNAIKFTEKGGRVDVSLCGQSGMNWQIVVKDTGMGISPERLPDIFEPFRRSSDYAKRRYQGIGLGLSIVKRIVQLSGGDISVASIIGGGSTFTVTLPTKLRQPESLTKQNQGL